MTQVKGYLCDKCDKYFKNKDKLCYFRIYKEAHPEIKDNRSFKGHLCVDCLIDSMGVEIGHKIFTNTNNQKGGIS